MSCLFLFLYPTEAHWTHGPCTLLFITTVLTSPLPLWPSFRPPAFIHTKALLSKQVTFVKGCIHGHRQLHDVVNSLSVLNLLCGQAFDLFFHQEAEYFIWIFRTPAIPLWETVRIGKSRQSGNKLRLKKFIREPVGNNSGLQDSHLGAQGCRQSKSLP